MDEDFTLESGIYGEDAAEVLRETMALQLPSTYTVVAYNVLPYARIDEGRIIYTSSITAFRG